MPFREGLSVALMEAMSSGMAIFCSEIRGITDLVEDGVSGVYVKNDPQSVAQAIAGLQADPQLRARLGAGAAEKALLFDDENVHRIMKEIYLSV